MHIFQKRYPVLYIVVGLVGVALILVLVTFPGEARLVTSAPLAACPPNQTDVNSTADDNSCGTLRYALNYALNNPGNNQVNITLATGSIINISSSGLAVPAGVSITTTVPCNPVTGPAIAINGTGVNGVGLTLNGGSTIYGVRIFGFNGQQIKANVGLNTLTCVKASRNVTDLNITLAPKTGSLATGANNLTYTLTPLDSSKRISGFTLDITTTGPLNITSVIPIEPNPPQPVFTLIRVQQLSAQHFIATYVINKPANQLLPTVQITLATQATSAGNATVTIAASNSQVVGNIFNYKYGYFSIDQGSYTIN